MSGNLLPSDARAGAARALEAMIDAVHMSQSESRSMCVKIVFTPRGEIVVGHLGRMTTEMNEADNEDEIALAAAKKRGEVAVTRILSGPEMLTGERFAELVGMTRMAVHKRLKKNQILGLKGFKRGVRYPKWQLDDDGRLVAGLTDLLAKFGSQTWVAYRFLLQRHSGLGKMTAIEALKAGKTRMVLEAADTVLSGDFS